MRKRRQGARVEHQNATRSLDIHVRKYATRPDVDPTAARTFDLFVADSVLRAYDLTDADIGAGCVGGDADGGIDGLYGFVNTAYIREETELDSESAEASFELHILQAKASQKREKDAVRKVTEAFTEMFDCDVPVEQLASYRPELVALVAKFRALWTDALELGVPDLAVTLHYATHGDISTLGTQPGPQEKAFSKSVVGLFSMARSCVKHLGAEQLVAQTRAKPLGPRSLGFAQPLVFGGESASGSSYILRVPLARYYDFITSGHGPLDQRIFDTNVRDYLGNKSVNKAIRGTLEHPGAEEFWWLNNGITMTCRKAGNTGSTMTIEDPQIVNGMQTSVEIHKRFSGDATPEEQERHLLVGLIVTEDSAVRDAIIRATNSQTAIGADALRATDPIHRQIEEFLLEHGLFYDRRKNQYKREGKPRSKIVSIRLMTQCMVALVLHRPDVARARPLDVLKDDARYAEAFSAKYRTEAYLHAVQLVRRVDSYILDETGWEGKDHTNLLFYVAAYAYRVLRSTAHVASPAGEAKALASLDPDGLTADALRRAADVVWGIYSAQQEPDVYAKGVDFVPAITRALPKN